MLRRVGPNADDLSRLLMSLVFDNPCIVSHNASRLTGLASDSLVSVIRDQYFPVSGSGTLLGE